MSVIYTHSVVTTGTIETIIQNSSTLPILLQHLPTPYRSVLGRHLQEYYRVSQKVSSAQAVLTTFNKHSAEGSYPPPVLQAVKAPPVQFSKEFQNSAAMTLNQETINAMVKESRDTFLEKLIEVKKSEVATLQTILAFDEKTWKADCRRVLRDLCTTMGLPNAYEESGDGRMTFTNSAPQDMQIEFKKVHQEGRRWYLKAMSLAYSVVERSVVRKMAKVSLKEKTDTTMTDAPVDKPVRSVVKEELEVALTKFRKGDALFGIKSSSLTAPRLRKRQRSEGESAEQKGSNKIFKLEKTTDNSDQDLESGQKNWKDEMTALGRIVKLPSGRWANPSTLPDSFLKLRDISCQIASLSYWTEAQVDSRRARKLGVFKGPGVPDIPDDIDYFLSNNLKFIFPQDLNFTLVRDAYAKFCRTVRIRHHFKDQEDTDFIARIHVPNPTWNPPSAPAHIEAGLEAGMAALRDFLRTLPNPDYKPKLRRKFVRDFMLSENLLLKITDKNLGPALITKEWYEREVHKHLEDRSVYQPVLLHEGWLDELQERVSTKIKELRLPRRYQKFLNTAKNDLPRFHIIPKIHKEPWASRPIVPSHSWITTQASEIVDLTLRPLLKTMPWVVNSTTEVVRHLHILRKGADLRNCWLVTGDITAFYTNIPPYDCTQICFKLYKKIATRDSEINPKQLGHLLQIVLRNNFFRYGSSVYKQSSGLAMGTSCAPLIANLFAGQKELETLSTLQPVDLEGGSLLLYNRYIDDILLIYKGSKEELDLFLSLWTIGNLEIKWNVSRVEATFLDLEIHAGMVDSYSASIFWRLHKKRLNRHLYIPYSSSHPLAVKRAFVKGELVRILLNSSTKQFFVESCSQFYSNLRLRGYPPQILDYWFRMIKWDQLERRLFKERVQSPLPLMLPSEYNPVWECVNIRQLTRVLYSEWSKGDVPDALQRPVIKSLARSHNLFDQVTKWNIDVLSTAQLT